MALQGGQGNFAHGPDVLTLLNRDLANEMNTMLMYMADSLLVRGLDSHDISDVFSTFANQDFKHAKKLAVRIVELEGTPELLPSNLQNNASIDTKPPHRHAARPMLEDALEHEMQSVIEYKNQVQGIAFDDPATRLLLEEILSDKEHQAEQIRNLLGA